MSRQRFIGAFVCAIGIFVLSMMLVGYTSASPIPADSSALALQDTPTYYRDIEPVLVANCMGCHTGGGIGQSAMNMEDVTTIHASARELAFVTGTRIMPPWMPGASSPRMKNERKLADDDIRLINAWFQAGAPLGNIADRPTTPPPSNIPTLREDLVLSMREPYTPTAELIDDYRCFLIDPAIERDTYVAGYTVIPGQPALVHHVIVFQVPGTMRKEALERNAEDEAPGWQCFGGSGLGQNRNNQADTSLMLEVMIEQGVDLPRFLEAMQTGVNFDASRIDFRRVREALEQQGVDFQKLVDAMEDRGLLNFVNMGLTDSVANWVPGSVPTLYPQGAGVAIPAGNLLVMQVHYNVNVPPAPDQTRVVLQLADDPANTVSLYGMAVTAPVEIPCPAGVTGEACSRDYAVENAQNPFSPDALLARCQKTVEDFADQTAGNAISTCQRIIRHEGWIVQVGGHMHLRGKSITSILNPGTPQETVLLDIPAWDFHWQGNYQLANPIAVKSGDIVQITCTWDNSAGDRYIVWAEGSRDEMCLNTIMILPAVEGKTLADFGY